MHDILGKPLAPGDIIAYHVDWEGLAIGIVYRANPDWITFYDDHDGRQRVRPNQCALLSSAHRGQHFTTIQDVLTVKQVGDKSVPHDVLKTPSRLMTSWCSITRSRGDT